MNEKITQTIEDLINDFESYPDKYLTESDVRCILFKKLIESKEFSQLQHTEDNSFSIPLHTEVRWYGESGRLRWRSDIVIVDVSSLRVKNIIFRLPTKGFGFNKPLAIIEIKLRRINGASDSIFVKNVCKDIKKLEEIINELHGDYFCCLIILDKKKNIEEMIKYLYRENRIKIFYKYSGNNRQSNKK
jgi:hypothetical protein